MLPRRDTPSDAEGFSPRRDGPPCAPGPAELARAAWLSVTPRLAGTPHIQISRDRGRTYPARHARPLPAEPPGQPCTVPVYDPGSATGRMLALGLDPGRGRVGLGTAARRRVGYWPARRLTIRSRAGEDAVRSRLSSHMEPYSPRHAEGPQLGGPQHNRIPARSDPYTGSQPSPGPEQKAINRGHDNRPAG